MSTPQCRQLNLRFRQSEQQVTKGLIKYKFKVANAYWGHVDDSGAFPKNSGTSIKGRKLSRIGTSLDHGWEQVEDSYCSTNMCKTHTPEVIKNGHETYQFSLIKKAIRSDWLCLNSLVLREIAEEELAHFEEGLRQAARYHWDEVFRSRYIDLCDHKMVPIIPPSVTLDGTTCDIYVKACLPTHREDGFMWETRINDDGSAGELNEMYLRVNVNPTQIDRISEMTLDMLDEASLYLEFEDENMPKISEGIDLYDVVLADYRMANRFNQQEDIEMGGAMSYGGFEASKLKRLLGTKGVFRKRYSVRYDMQAAKFYPDGEFNTELVNSDGYAYSQLDPSTWPRFKRVLAYIPKLISSENGVGMKYVVNRDFIHAPFGITTLFSKLVIKGLQFPDLSGIGSARKQGPGAKLGYQGIAQWYNPQWECNEDNEKGFWKLRFGIAIKPFRTEFGFAWFHRIDQRIAFQPNCCDIPNAPCVDEVSPYCYKGMVGPDEELNGTFGANVVQETGGGQWCD